MSVQTTRYTMPQPERFLSTHVRPWVAALSLILLAGGVNVLRDTVLFALTAIGAI